VKVNYRTVYEKEEVRRISSQSKYCKRIAEILLITQKNA